MLFCGYISIFSPMHVHGGEIDKEEKMRVAKAYADRGDFAQSNNIYQELSDQGYAPARKALGLAYMKGEGVRKDEHQAYEFFSQAANQGDIPAQVFLAGCYAHGMGVAQNIEKSVFWFKQASDQGNSKAQFHLGLLYLKGNGVAQDINHAIRLLKFSATQGYLPAQVRLAEIYENGIGTKKDYREAVKWYTRAAESEHFESQLKLSLFYGNGIGVPKNEIEALAWMNIAASSGDERAIRSRDAMELRLGHEITLYAQQRSSEILQQMTISKEKESHFNSIRQSSQFVGNIKGFGSGSFISDDGLILTAAHVVAGGRKIEVVTNAGQVQAKLLDVDKKNDIAILECRGKYESLPIVTSRLIKLGQSVFTIGFPNVEIQGFSPKVTKGEINSMSGFRDDPNTWQISVPVQPGNSGGPLIDANGNIVGMIVSKLSAVNVAKIHGDIPQNVNYAVKSDAIRPLLDKYNSRLRSFDTISAEIPFETIVRKTQNSIVMIVVYD